MEENERLGASFSINITALKTGLQQANRLIRESNSEFKAAAAGLDDWTKSEEGLTAKLKNLNDVAEIQSKKVNALQEEYDRCVADGLEPMSAAAVKMRTDINNEKAALEKTKSEINKYQKSLDELADSTDEAGNEMEDLGDSAEKASDGFTIAKGAIADLISNGIQALAGACKNAISSIAGLADETRESRTEFAKLEASFESAGLGAEAAQKTMSDLYGILGDTGQATEASNLIAKMSKNQEDLDKNTRILTGVFAEYGDSIPIEGLAEAMASTSEMSSVQGVLADALEWQGINLDDYNDKLASMSTAEERAAYIQETLTELYGESADAYRENNKALIEANEAQLEHEKSLNRFGDMIEPITTKVKNGFNKIIGKIAELVEDVDFEEFGKKIDKAFDAFINDVMPKVITALDWVKKNGKTIISIVSSILAGFLAFKAVTGIIQAVSAAQAVWNAVMAASPITWITLGIAALVAAIVLLIQNWDALREAGEKAWEWIKNAWGTAANWFEENVIKPIVKFFRELWQSVSGFFSALWEGITSIFITAAKWLDENVIQPVINLVKPFIDFIIDLVRVCWQIISALWGLASEWFNKNVIQPVANFFKDLWEKVSGFFKQLWKDIKSVWNSVATWFDENVVQPIAGFFSNLWSNLKTKASDTWENIKKVFSNVGDFFGGIWDTIKEKFTNVGVMVAEAIGGAFKNAINAVIGTVEKALNKIPKAINSALDLINELPGVDISPMSEISLPRLAKGGIVRSATNAIIGEDGAEAIIPLEKNTEWIDNIADRLASKSNVVINQTNNYSQAHSRYELYKSKQQTAAAVRLALQGV